MLEILNKQEDRPRVAPVLLNFKTTYINKWFKDIKGLKAEKNNNLKHLNLKETENVFSLLSIV